MKVKNFCKNYFDSYSGFKPQKSTKINNEKNLNGWKVASYFTIVLPLIFGVVYGISSLVGRCSHNTDPNETDRRT